MYNSAFFSVPSQVQPIFYLLLIIDVILKGVTLYKSARRDQMVWFILLLIVNSFGILPIIYLIANRDIALVSAAPAPKKTVKKGRK